MAMLRHKQKLSARASTLLLYSSRAPEDIIYRKELEAMARHDPDLRIIHALTHRQPHNWTGHRGLIDKALLADAGFPPGQNPKIFVCGPTAFVEDVSHFLVELGHQPSGVKTERFGPSGASLS